MNTVQKPLTMVTNEFAQQVVALINNSKLPPFIMEPILKDMYMTVKDATQRQLAADTQKYEEMVAETEAQNAAELEKQKTMEKLQLEKIQQEALLREAQQLLEQEETEENSEVISEDIETD